MRQENGRRLLRMSCDSVTGAGMKMRVTDAFTTIPNRAISHVQLVTAVFTLSVASHLCGANRTT